MKCNHSLIWFCKLDLTADNWSNRTQCLIKIHSFRMKPDTRPNTEFNAFNMISRYSNSYARLTFDTSNFFPIGFSFFSAIKVYTKLWFHLRCCHTTSPFIAINMSNRRYLRWTFLCFYGPKRQKCSFHPHISSFISPVYLRETWFQFVRLKRSDCRESGKS